MTTVQKKTKGGGAFWTIKLNQLYGGQKVGGDNALCNFIALGQGHKSSQKLLMWAYCGGGQ